MKKGDTIASVGGYGGVSPHLHFEVRFGVDQVVYPYSKNILLLGAEPQLTLRLNETTFQWGDTLILTAAITAPAIPTVVDAYVAIRLPDGSLCFLQGNGSLTRAVRPIVTNWTVAPFNGEIFRYTFGGGEPQGNYTWLAV